MKRVKCALIGPGNIGTDLLVQAAAQRGARAGVDGRHRPDLRRPEACPRDGHQDHRRGRGRPAAARARPTASRSPSTPPAPTCMPRTRRKLNALGVMMIDLTPAAIGPFCVPPVNLKAARRPARDERQHGHLRRPGDDPDGRRGLARAAGRLRRDRRHRLRRSRSARARARTSTNSPAPPPARSRRSAAPRRARPSSSSTRPSRR